jgi:hypothetical protein
MNLKDKISTFDLWGKKIKAQLEEIAMPAPDFLPTDAYADENQSTLFNLMKQQYFKNNWFTPYHVYRALDAIGTNFLNQAELEKWIGNYPGLQTSATPKKIGITMAGNIPLVGFHDLLCVWASGHIAFVKLSSKDNLLLPYLLEILFEIDERFKESIQFSEHLLKGCDGYIATGSDNSARYFDYYFGKYPHIIRRNRSSLAYLDGTESAEELSALMDDVFVYFGLGCRNVSMLLVPPNYDFTLFLEATKKYGHYFQLAKYANNYDYQYTLLLMNRLPHWKSDNLLIVPSTGLLAPISVVNYHETDSVTAFIDSVDTQTIQCIVGKQHLPFGCTQSPTLSDYADNIDTVAWLQSV